MKKTELVSIGEKIKEYRKINSLTQNEMAQSSGISIATLKRLENENHIPRLEISKKLKKILPKDLGEELLKLSLSKDKIKIKISVADTPKAQNISRKYFDGRWEGASNSNFAKKTLLITKIREFNDKLYSNWGEVSLLLGIAHPDDIKRIADWLRKVNKNMEKSVKDIGEEIEKILNNNIVLEENNGSDLSRIHK